MPKVSIVKCRDYGFPAAYDHVKKSVDLLGGIHAFIKKGERILIKPNLLAARPVEAAVTTHPDVVRAVIRLVKDAGAVPIIGDSPGIGSAIKIAEKCGIAAICREEKTELIELKTLVLVENPGGHTFKRLEVADEVLKVDGIINVPKLKTHAQMLLTLAVKNLFGCVPGKRKPQWHLAAGVQSSHFASMLLDLYFFLSPRLTVMDGIIGMEGNGPGSGDPRRLELLLASPDCLSMDSVIAELLGARVRDIPILKAALGRGHNEARLENIEVLGEAIDNVRVKSFRFPPVMSTNFADRLPYFIDKRLRKALTARPHVNNKDCTLCNICVDVCPAEVMQKTSKIEIDYDRCIRCYCCQEMCPQGAIISKDGWLKRLIPGM